MENNSPSLTQTESRPLIPPAMNWRPLDLDEAIPPWFSRGGMILFSGIEVPMLMSVNQYGHSDGPVWLISARGVMPEEVKTYRDLSTYVKAAGIEMRSVDYPKDAPPSDVPMVCVCEWDASPIFSVDGGARWRAFREDAWHPAIPGNELPRGNVKGDTLLIRLRRSNSIGVLTPVWFVPENGDPCWFGRVGDATRKVKVWEDLMENPDGPPVSTWEFRFVSAVP